MVRTRANPLMPSLSIRGSACEEPETSRKYLIREYCILA